MENTSEIAILNPATQEKTFCSIKATTVAEKKKLYNALQQCDYKLNDVKGQNIKVKDIYIREYVQADENGNESTKHTTILFDEAGKSYVTASNFFYYALARIISVFGEPSTWDEPLELQITEQNVKNSSNKALSCKLVA